jgi:hypothetical protein
VFRMTFQYTGLLFGLLFLNFFPTPIRAASKICASEAALQEVHGVFLAVAKVTGTGKKTISARMLVDTGAPYTTLSQQVCNQVKCKDAKNNPSPVVLAFGGEAFAVMEPEPESSETPSKYLKADGVLGADVLLAKDIVLDLRKKTLCILPDTLENSYLKLGLKKMKARYDSDGLAWIDVVAKDVKANCFFDSGSNRTSFALEDIKRMKLPKTGNGKYADVRHDGYTLDHFGPVTISIANFTKKLDYISEAPISEHIKYTKLGTDFMSGFKIGFSSQSGHVYISESKD